MRKYFHPFELGVSHFSVSLGSFLTLLISALQTVKSASSSVLASPYVWIWLLKSFPVMLQYQSALDIFPSALGVISREEEKALQGITWVA